MLSVKSFKTALSAISGRKSKATSFRSANSQASMPVPPQAAPSVASDLPSSVGTLSVAPTEVTAINEKGVRAFEHQLRFDTPLNPSTLSALPSTENDPQAKVGEWLSKSAHAGLSTIPRPMREPKPLGFNAKVRQAHQKLLKNVVTPGKWAGELELTGMARSLNVAIKVVQRDPSAQATGDVHVGKVQTVINPDARKSIYVAYNGTHYDALQNVQLGENGMTSAYFQQMPADGNCAYHAVAATALPSAAVLTGLYELGQLSLQTNNPVWKGVFAGENISEAGAYGVMRQAYALQLRYDTANELKSKVYAEAAFNAQIVGA